MPSDEQSAKITEIQSLINSGTVKGPELDKLKKDVLNLKAQRGTPYVAPAKTKASESDKAEAIKTKAEIAALEKKIDSGSYKGAELAALKKQVSDLEKE